MLKRVKNFLRLTMTQEHFPALGLLSIETEMIETTRFNGKL